ncbi:hypothetical protein DPMN_077587, partial [Dreissena polymorpha]
MRMRVERLTDIREFIYRSYWPLHEVTVARPAPVTSQEKKINFRVKVVKFTPVSR